jgi:hypothetical protein
MIREFHVALCCALSNAVCDTAELFNRGVNPGRVIFYGLASQTHLWTLGA